MEESAQRRAAMLPAVNWESDVGGLPSPWGPHRSWAPIWSLFEVCFLQQCANINVSTKAKTLNQMNTLYCPIPHWLQNPPENFKSIIKKIFITYAVIITVLFFFFCIMFILMSYYKMLFELMRGIFIFSRWAILLTNELLSAGEINVSKCLEKFLLPV